MRCRLRAAASLFSFLAAQARKLSLSGSLGWAERARKYHPRKSDGGAAMEALSKLSVLSVFWVYPSVFVAFGRSSWLKNWAWDRHDFVLGATAGVRCAMVCRRGHAWWSGRHSLRFTIYCLGCCGQQFSYSPRIASGTLAESEHAMSSWINSSNSIKSNSIFSKIIIFGLLCQLDWIEFSSPHAENAFFVSHFLSIINQFDPIQKAEFDLFFCFVKTGPKQIPGIN